MRNLRAALVMLENNKTYSLIARYIHSPNPTNRKRACCKVHTLQQAHFLQVDGRVHAVDIALIQLPPQQLNGLAEALEVDHLPLPEELDDVVHIGIIAEPQDVIIGDTSLLLWERIA